jgi:Ca2+-binding RTX toxin-like protein
VTAIDDGDLSFSEDFTLTVNDLSGVTIVGSSRADVINAARTAPGQALPTNDDDIIFGLGGNDTIVGLGGADIIDGGAGNDIIYGGYGNDRLIGGAGADRLYGGEDDNVFVISGADAQSDMFYGGAGMDTIEVGGVGSVTLSRFSAAACSIEIWEGNGQAVLGTSRADVIDFSGFQTYSGVAYIDTAGGNDLIIGCGSAEYLRGGVGNDAIHAGEGNDRLVGGAGMDALYGGGGDDVFVFGGGEANGDAIRGEAGADSIEISGTASVTMSRFDAGISSIENWVGNGNGVIGTNSADLIDFSDLTSVSGLAFIDGGKGNDWLTGSFAADDLRGGVGNDVLTGGLGDDILRGGVGNDRFVFAPGFGNDTITDFASGWRVGDVIAVDADIFADLDSLLAACVQAGDSVVITASATDTLTLQNTMLGNLHTNDFLFV